MNDKSNSEKGLSLTDAWHRLTDRDLYCAYQEAVEAVKEAAPPANLPVGGYLSYSDKERARRAKAENETIAALTEDFWKQVGDCQLVLVGDLTPFNPSVPAVRIRPDLLRMPRPKIDWSYSEILGRNVKYINVLVYPASEAPEVTPETPADSSPLAPVEAEENKYEKLIERETLKSAAIQAAKDLRENGDPGGQNFHVRIADALGLTVDKKRETVRNYVKKFKL